MRLCFINYRLNVHAERWLGFFVERGHEVHSIADQTGPNLPGVILHSWVPEPRLPKLGTVQAALRVRRIMRRIEPDLVHAIVAGMPGWLGALSGHYPFVISVMGSEVLASAGAYDKWLGRALTRFALRHADLIIAQSSNLLGAIQPFGLEKVPQRTIPIGVCCSHFVPARARPTLFRRLEIPAGSPVVLSPRHTRPIYNTDLIIRAMPGVLARHPQAVFVFKEHWFLNTTNYRGSCKALVRELGVAANARWVEETLSYSEIPDFYACGDVAVSVARSDGLPVSVLEAMACGLPLVLAPLAGVQESIVPQKNALYVDPVEPETISSAINTLLDSQALRVQMGRANRSLALAKFNFVPLMEQVETVYKELLAEGGAS
ncbi:glycosyltransferase family 4 protein [Acidobacteria bacterium AH-259-A15]|nr:glycosyltransferase family 4 protein [Acidobacteria bacterium AH-259-A15]